MAPRELSRSPLDTGEPDGSANSTSQPDEQVDFFGNAVTDAVARYRLDRFGSLYEQHAPRVELPRLPPPKS